MNKIKKLGRKKDTMEIILEDGQKMIVHLQALFISTTEEYLEEEFKAIQAIREEIENMPLENVEEDYLAFTKIISVERYKITLKHSERIWQMMTGIQDCSWLYKACPADLEEIMERFMKINSILDSTKKNLERISKTGEILQDFAENIRSQQQVYPELLTPFLRDIAYPHLRFIIPGHGSNLN